MTEAGETTVVHAAGAVLWRYRDGSREPELAVVHRPRYDDWSLPKGKVDRGETLAATAVREIREETGISAVLGRRLGSVGYEVLYRGATAHKVVDYFAARATSGTFAPNDEVDEVRWLPAGSVGELLTYRRDNDLVAQFAALPADTRTVLLVRHAKAGDRTKWTDDDDLRPLNVSGRRQAEALRALLPLFGADRVHSAPLVRCRETVRRVAEDLAVDLTPEPLLSEEGYWAEPELGLARLAEIVKTGGVPVVCSQGGVIPDLVRALAQSGGVDLAEPASKKGSVWVLSFNSGAETEHSDSVASAGRNTEIRLLAADYVPDPAA